MYKQQNLSLKNYYFVKANLIWFLILAFPLAYLFYLQLIIPMVNFYLHAYNTRHTICLLW